MAACGGGPALAGGKTPKAALPRGDLQILGKSRGAAEGSAPGTRKKASVAVGPSVRRSATDFKRSKFHLSHRCTCG
jgi:hypothetical protein